MKRLRHGYAVRENGSPKRIYRIWCAIIQRCTNPNNVAFKYYGGKGITICDSWRKFENFRKDMEPSYLEGLTIHRKDGSLGYCADNCEWATRKIQMCHTSRTRNITINGVTKPICLWADYYGIARKRLFKRLKDGWNEIEAIITPLQKWTSSNGTKYNQ